MKELALLSAFHSSARRLRSIVRLPHEREWFDAIGGEKLSIVVHSDDVGGRFSIYESIAEPGTRTPLHYHAQDELFHVLAGTLTFSVDGTIFDAHPGTTVLVPAGTPHGWSNRKSQPPNTLVTFMPGGLEEFFTQLSGADLKTIERIAKKYGTHVVGLPIGD